MHGGASTSASAGFVDSFRSRGVITHGLAKHGRIFHRHRVCQRVAIPRESFDDMHVLGVKVAVAAEPRVFDEVGHVDDERIGVEAAHRIAHVRRIRRRRGADARRWESPGTGLTRHTETPPAQASGQSGSVGPSAERPAAGSGKRD